MSQTSQTLPKAKTPLRVGITGGIGSGKTTVCRIFEALGIPVYYADERAKLLMTENNLVVSQIKDLFGEQAYLPDHSLNRQWVAAIVFQNADMLDKLNAIVHPAVQLDGENWHQQQYNVPYTIKETALLFEIGSEVYFDKTIVVHAPKAIRLRRTMLRDGLTEAQVEARMNKQMDDEKKAQLADYVIFNDNEHQLITQVWDIHRSLVVIHQDT